MVHLAVKNNIRKIAKNIDISEDVAPALDKKIEQIIKDAVIRARANGRKTLQGRDI